MTTHTNTLTALSPTTSPSTGDVLVERAQQHVDAALIALAGSKTSLRILKALGGVLLAWTLTRYARSAQRSTIPFWIFQLRHALLWGCTGWLCRTLLARTPRLRTIAAHTNTSQPLNLASIAEQSISLLGTRGQLGTHAFSLEATEDGVFLHAGVHRYLLWIVTADDASDIIATHRCDALVDVIAHPGCLEFRAEGITILQPLENTASFLDTLHRGASTVFLQPFTYTSLTNARVRTLKCERI